MNEVLARRALLLLEQAQELLSEALETQTGGGSDENSPVNPVRPTEQAVIWGRDGLSGTGDPRRPSASHHEVREGLVTAVHTQVHVLPEKAYRCTSVSVIDEQSAGGRHVAYVGQVGGAETVALFTGYGGGLTFDNTLYHAAREEVVIDGGFDPPDLGPLAIALVDSQGNILSDVVASLGLPGRHHVCYVIEFSRR